MTGWRGDLDAELVSVLVLLGSLLVVVRDPDQRRHPLTDLSNSDLDFILPSVSVGSPIGRLGNISRPA